MKNSYVLKTFAICCTAFLIVYAGFVAKNFWKNKKIVEEPQKPQKTEYQYNKAQFLDRRNRNTVNHLTRAEIVVKDDLKSPNGKIYEVKFNDDALTLRPATPRGNRGSTFLQLKPGTYTISWTVKNSRYTWPRFTTHTKTITVNPNTNWIHISIEGNNITIS